MPAPGRADALGEIALRHQFELDVAGAVERVEDLRVGLARKRADDLADAPRLQQRGEAGLAVAGVVVDDRQVARALRDQRVDQLRRHAGRAEAADHHGRAVGHVVQTASAAEATILSIMRPSPCGGRVPPSSSVAGGTLDRASAAIVRDRARSCSLMRTKIRSKTRQRSIARTSSRRRRPDACPATSRERRPDREPRRPCRSPMPTPTRRRPTTARRRRNRRPRRRGRPATASC